MPPVAACPAWARYQELAAGRLAGRPDAEVLLAHLERCDACAGKVPSLPGPDPLGGLLRQAQACGKGAGLARLIDRLASRRSGDTSSVRHAETLPPRDPSAALLTADCPACGKAVKARPELAGKRVKCPYCKQPLRLPAAHEPSPAPPPIDAGGG